MSSNENPNAVPMTPAQMKMARAALDLSVRDAAALATISHDTVVRIERGDATVKPFTLARVRAALEAAGVVFIPENGGGAGVRLRERSG